jgi:hypothetical protein
MASPTPETKLDELTGRRFSFYPAIRNIEHNEWTLKEEKWAEILVSNVETGMEIWIPRNYLGGVSSSDSPVLIVGLNHELEWKAGRVWPHRERVLEMPPRKPTAKAAPSPPGARSGSDSEAESHARRLIFGALAVGLVACLLVIMYAFDGLRNPLDILFPTETTTADQRYLGVTGSDGYDDIVLKVARPEREQWISRPEAQIQFQILWYPSRGYALVLMGADRKTARYIGALHVPSRKILDTVKLSDGGTTASMLKNLPEF